MNTLEEQLRSWKPRHPSPNLERQLFGERQYFSFTLARQVGQPMLHESESQTAVIAMSLSNQNYAPYLATSFQPTANRLDTFGWTNGGYSKSSVSSFTPQKGN